MAPHPWQAHKPGLALAINNLGTMFRTMVRDIPGKTGIQASTEYMSTYVIAIVILVIALALVFYLSNPSAVPPPSCQFSSGFTCVDSVIGINSISSNTVAVLFIENSQDYPITGPNAIVRIGTTNSSAVGTPCQPNYVKPGGVILCLVNLTQKSQKNQLVTGTVYLTANYCGLSTSKACTGATRETYVGSLVGHTQTVSSYVPTITLAAATNSLPPNGQRDDLFANVVFLGQTISGATVNFTANNTVPVLGGEICGSTNTLAPCSSFSNSNRQGEAESNIWSYQSVVVKTWANFSGASANVVIIFGYAATSLARSCSTKGTGTLYPAVDITNANDVSYDPLNVNPSSAGVYILDKLTGDPVVIQVNGNGKGATAIGVCFDINTTVGGGTLAVNTNGNNENTIAYIEGPAAVTVGNNGNNNGQTIGDSGTGPVTGTINGNGGFFVMSTGTGNVMLNVNGNNQAVSNITTASANVEFTMNGNNQGVNITDTATSGNALLSENGNNQQMNLTYNSGVTIVVTQANGNNNVFNSIGGYIVLKSIGGNNNVFNLKDEVVYITSCNGNNDQINLLDGSVFAAGSPYHSGTTGCLLNGVS
jgi:hypothetical protein